MFQFENRPLTIREVFINSLQLMWEHLVTISPVSIVVSGLSVLSNWLLSDLALAYTKFAKVAQTDQTLTFDPTPYLTNIKISFVIGIISGVMVLGLLVWLKQLANSPKSQFLDAQRDVFKRLIACMLAAIMFSLIVGIGMMLFILPGIYLSVALAMVLPILLFDNQSVWQSIKGSYHLVKGAWWHTFGSMFAVVAAIKVVSFLLLLPISHGGMPATVAMTNTYALAITFIVNIVAVPVILSMLLVLFHDLNVRQAERQAPAKPGNDA